MRRFWRLDPHHDGEARLRDRLKMRKSARLGTMPLSWFAAFIVRLLADTRELCVFVIGYLPDTSGRQSRNISATGRKNASHSKRKLDNQERLLRERRACREAIRIGCDSVGL
jgi:hypothetical protein